MTTEILMHINETMNAAQQQEFLRAFGNRPGGLQAHLHSTREHLLFIAYDPEELCPHDLVAIAEENGVHAQLIDI
ncbi:MAG: hypothetical protein OQL08_07715 [Gammaproteobacteria bacterium]|nr:hypothetical protein [Gammaproteobacteria bacterium]